MKRLSLSLALSVTLTACGGDPGEDLVGIWRVETHTKNTTGCASEGSAVMDPPYIRFIAGNLLGQEYVERVDCTSATPETCDMSSGLFGLLYSEEIDGGMKATVYGSSGSDQSCTFFANTSTAILAAGALRIETRLSRESNVAATCDLDEAERRAGSLPCTELEVMTAVKP